MQEAVPVGAGAMAAILGLDAAAVRAGCAEARASADSGEVVEAVNFNDPKQIVIAGSKAAVDKACEAAQGRRRQARAAAAGVGAVPFEPDEAGRRARCASGWRRRRLRRAAHPGDQQRRRRRSRPSRRRSATRWCARPTARCAGSRRCRRSARRGVDARRRVRPGQGAGRPDQAHRRPTLRRRRCSTRRRSPTRQALLAMSDASDSIDGQVALVTGASRGIGRGDRAGTGAARATRRRHRDHRSRRGGDRRCARRPSGGRGMRRSTSTTAPRVEALIDEIVKDLRRPCTCWSTTPASRATSWRCA